MQIADESGGAGSGPVDVSGRGRLLAWAAFVGAYAVLSYASRLAGGKPPPDVLYEYGTAAAGLVQGGFVLGVVLLISRPWSRDLLALRRPTSWGVAAGLGLAVLVGVLVAGSLLEVVLDPGSEQGLVPTGWDEERAGAFAANFVVVAGLAPVVEELLFRGLGFSLLQRYGTPVTVVVVGVAFGLAHGLVEGLPLLAAMGMGLAYLRSRTRSVLPCIALHAVFNALVLTIAVSG